MGLGNGKSAQIGKQGPVCDSGNVKTASSKRSVLESSSTRQRKKLPLLVLHNVPS